MLITSKFRENNGRIKGVKLDSEPRTPTKRHQQGRCPLCAAKLERTEKGGAEVLLPIVRGNQESISYLSALHHEKGLAGKARLGVRGLRGEVCKLTHYPGSN